MQQSANALHRISDGHGPATEQQCLTDLLKRLSDARQRNASGPELHSILVAALDFARSHVQDEEAVMAAVCYPDLNEHRAAHEDIIRKLAACASRVESGKLEAAEEAGALLRSWLDEHFDGADRHFHEYVIAFLLHRLHVGFDGETRDATAVHAEEERFRAIIEAAPNAILVVDEHGLICVVNSQAERLFGFNRTELLGKAIETIIPERLRKRHSNLRQVFSASPEVRSMGAGRELFGLRKDGSEVPVEIGLSPLHTVEGRFVLASIIDISRRKQAEQVLRAAEANALQESILRNLPASVIASDTDGNIVAINPAAEHLLGYSGDELLGHSMMLIHEPQEIQRRAIELSKQLGLEIKPNFQVLVASGSYDAADEREWTYCRKDGTQVPVNVAVTTLRNPAGKVFGFLTVATDISARKRAEMAMRMARRSRLQVAVLLLDLDQFKQVNDSLGHQVGDDLLLAVAKRLRGSVRDVDTVARLGGDEFVIVITDVSDQESLASLIGNIRKSVSLPLRIEQNELNVSLSMGGCLFPKDGVDAITLLKKADSAMYQAKASGRGNFKWFTEAMMLESQEKLVLENALRDAVRRQEMSLHFQPKLSLKTGQIVGTEALLRWHHPEKGDISPARFIPIAEDTGLIVSLGEWALRAACRQSSEMQRRLGRPLTVAVNVSARQLNDKHLLQMIRSALTDSGLNPDQLELEITESVLMQYPEDCATLLRAIRELGVGIVIDDFGTGYSSLSYLTRFPIDKIKIDQSFVRDLATDPKDAAIVNAIIAMARRLNIVVVAEGVETIEQQNHLQDEACDEAQGFLYAKGLPMEELVQTFGHIESSVVLDKSRAKPAFELESWISTMEARP